ncbi:hypothetical protein CMI37_25655 [Candidatus Pacearchaeota archaeon]|jgi:hypothetical protein|nr:hypothetical protein [Candidatus Pacearchaeota archaeon]
MDKKPPDQWRELLTCAEASQKSGLNAFTLWSRVRGGSIRSYRRNGKVYVTLEDIGDWMPLWYRGHEAAIREAHAAGEPDAHTARILGLSRERVRQLRTRLGLPVNPPKPRLPKAFAPREV